MRKILLTFVLSGSVLLLTGCPTPKENASAVSEKKTEPATPEKAPSEKAPSEKPKPKEPQVGTDEEKAVLKRIMEFDENKRSFTVSPSGTLVAVGVESDELTLDDVKLIAKLPNLESLSIANCREFSDEYFKELVPLQGKLKTLRVENTILSSDSGPLLGGFTNLVELNLARNPRIGDDACQSFPSLEKLERLNMIYTGLTDVGLLLIRKIPNLQSLDIRGCSVIGDSGMRSVARIPKLKSFQHFSNSVSDDGLENLSKAEELESLFLQDFRLTDRAGEILKEFTHLKSLILFRCGEFGTEGLLQLKGMPLERLTLRDLGSIGDAGLEVFQDLPTLKRLYLTEMGTLTDAGIANIAHLKNLEQLEIELVPITDASLEVIAQLPNLKSLKLRTTQITDAGLSALLKLQKLQSLELLENPNLDPEKAKRILAEKKFRVLKITQARGTVEP